MKNKLPQTSHEANKSMTFELKQKHHNQIVGALKNLKKATYEEIADYLSWDDKNRVSRRLKELELEMIVYKPGEKKPTKSNRSAYVYALVKPEVTVMRLFD